MSGSMIGAHTLQRPTGIGELIEAGINFITAVDDVGVLLEAHKKRPAINKVMRFFVPNITAESMRKRDPREAARWYVNQRSDRADSDPLMGDKIFQNLEALRMSRLWLQGCNEPAFNMLHPTNPKADDIPDLDGYSWYCEFEIERIRQLANLGIKAACFNFSTGSPPIEFLTRIEPALPVMREFGAILGFHGYSVIPMASNREDTNRHELYFDWMSRAGFPDIPMAYTEWGRDRWLLSGITADEYLAEIIAGDQRLMRFQGNLLGAALYSLGGNEDWKDFLIDGALAHRLADYIRSVPDEPEPTPIPTPIPIPPSFKFINGDRVEVTADIGLRVRSSPVFQANTIIGVQKFGALGMIDGGPVKESGIVWWRILYDAQPSGWSSEAFLKKHIPVPPPPPPDPAPSDSVVFVERFDNGVYTPHPLQDNMRVPNGWLQWFANEQTPRIEGQQESQYWIPGEGIMRDRNTLHISEIDTMLRFPDGTYATDIYHYFRGWGRLWVKLWHPLTIPAGRYRLEIEFFPDILINQRIEDNKIVKEPDFNPVNNEFRFIIGRTELAFSDGHAHPSARYTTMSHTFDHGGGLVDIGGEWRARWGVPVVGWFIRSVKVLRVA